MVFGLISPQVKYINYYYIICIHFIYNIHFNYKWQYYIKGKQRNSINLLYKNALFHKMHRNAQHVEDKHIDTKIYSDVQFMVQDKTCTLIHFSNAFQNQISQLSMIACSIMLVVQMLQRRQKCINYIRIVFITYLIRAGKCWQKYIMNNRQQQAKQYKWMKFVEEKENIIVERR